jgi:probable rRNA maturation factor
MITVRVSFQSRTGNIGAGLFRECAELVLSGERKASASLSYVIVDDPSIHSMNRTYLHHDYPTDIISFPLGEADEFEGEMYISADTARRNAVEYRVSLREEFARLAIHGALHLCGYDDRTETDKMTMRWEEGYYFGQLPKSGRRAS